MMKSINKEILRLSVPAIVSNITVPLLGLCDTAISGHLGSELFLAAIAVGSVMLNVVFWLFGFLRMGTTGLTATAYGSGNDHEVRKIFSRTFLLAFVAGVLLILFRFPLMDILLTVVGADEGVEDFVKEYFLIRIWGAPALLAVMAISGWFVGVQSTFYPMLIAIVVNVINIVGSYLMVFHADMGFPGVAWGTLLSNWLGLVIAMICVIMIRRGKKIWCSLPEIVGGGGIGRFFSVNSNLFVRSACIICVTMGVTAAGARLGALTLAVNVIVMQFFQFFSFFMDGFAFSAEAMVGRWGGAKDPVMVKRVVKALLIWTSCMAVSFSLIYWGGGELVTDLLTDSENVRAGVNCLMLWICLIPVVSAWAFIYDGFYVGITDTRRMMIATMAATAVFYLLAFLKIADGRLYLGVGNNSWVWLAFLSYLMIRGLVLAVLWRTSLRKRLVNSEVDGNKG